MFNSGDEVIFLNEEGKGVIVKALGSGQFLVLNDLGFEVSYAAKLLVLVNKKTPPAALPLLPEEPQPQVPKPEKPASPPTPPSAEKQKAKRLGNEKEGLISGFTFEENAKGENSQWSLFVFNNTACHYYFTAKSKIGNRYFILEHGIIEKGDLLILSTFLPNDITDLKEIVVQAIAFHASPDRNPEPVNDVFKIKLPKLYNKTMFTPWAELHENALILKPEAKPNPVSAFSMPLAIAVEKAPKPKPTIKLPYLLEKEIDLHIEKLYPHHKSLASHEMLDLQLKAVKQTMDEAIVNHYKKVTFIHGVGNGILKEQTRKIIKSYSAVTIADGDYGRYGFGATTVFLD